MGDALSTLHFLELKYRPEVPAKLYTAGINCDITREVLVST